MALSLVTGPAAEPIDFADAQLQARITSSDEQSLIENLIVTAREEGETYTGRAYLTQTWDLKLCGFPCDGGPLWLPKPPLQSVTSVTYVDQNGDTQTWASASYTVVKPAGPQASKGYIVPAYGEFYPLTRDVPDAVTVRFVCGYTAPDLVPASLKSAIKMRVLDLYDVGRQSVIVGYGSIVAKVPNTIDALLWPYKVEF